MISQFMQNSSRKYIIVHSINGQYYQHANTDNIRKPIYGFNWKRTFANKDVNEMVKVFNKTILNIFNNILMTKIIHGVKTKSINLYTSKMNLITSLNQIFKLKSNIQEETIQG